MITDIKINLPKNLIDLQWQKAFTNLLSSIVTNRSCTLEFDNHFDSFKLSIKFGKPSEVKVDFIDNASTKKSVMIKGSTGREWSSPNNYTPIKINELETRLGINKIEITSIDHAGFNLPVYGSEEHPDIVSLKSAILNDCLLHEFPDNPDWLFIIPGNAAEILRKEKINYNKIRKPKFEIVNFRKTSKPLIQLDLGTNVQYPLLKKLFPEAIHADYLKNLWVYIQNETGVDICFVLGEDSGGDWSSFFKANRI